MKRFTENVNH